MKQPATIENLISVISETDRFFKNQAQRQVNVALTLRNWLIGLYIVEYELNGADRAEYGEKLIDRLSAQLKTKKLRGFSQRSLQLCRSFYLAYPQIQQSMTVESYLTDFEAITILQSLTAKFIGPKNTSANQISQSLTAKSSTA